MSGDVDAAPDSAVDDGTDEDFAAGFETAAVEGATATPAPAPQASESAAREAASESASAPVSQPAAQPEPPKYVQITEADLADLRQKADRGASSSEQVTQIGKQLDKVFGKLGAFEQVVSKLRAETPAGEKVAISEEDFGELAQEYPEIAKLQARGLNKALEKFRGTGSDPKALEEIGQRVETMRTESKAASVDTMLNAVLPDWRNEVKRPEFGDWLKAQPQDVQDMQMSDDPVVAARMLRLYDRHLLKSLFQPSAPPAPASTPAPQRSSTRQRQLAAAVPPRGDGAATPTQRQEEDPFEAGFRASRA